MNAALDCSFAVLGLAAFAFPGVDLERVLKISQITVHALMIPQRRSTCSDRVVQDLSNLRAQLT